MSATICIVSSGSLSSGPRVVKEADALSAAGYRVRVVVTHTTEWMARWDAELARAKPWAYTALDWGAAARASSALGLFGKASHVLARTAAERTGTLPLLPELVASDKTLALLWHARRERASLYIAHNLAALPAASALAHLYGARLAFDAEDDHFGELTPELQSSAQGRAVDAVQRRYLRRCDYVTAVSTGAAERLAERYRIAMPVVIRNVFPLAERASIDGVRRERRSAALSIYWYSQSLGLDRGLQDALRACGQLRGDFELHLRGHAPREVAAVLNALAREHGIAARVHLHEQVPPGELLSRSVEHDVGLALEQPVSDNRSHTITNKIFFYLLGGLALAATDTPGQRAILDAIPDAGFVAPAGDPSALARGLQRYLDDPAALAAAKRASAAAAETRFNWEQEQSTLREAVARCLRGRRAA